MTYTRPSSGSGAVPDASPGGDSVKTGITTRNSDAVDDLYGIVNAISLGCALNSFRIDIINSSGTLNHRIGAWFNPALAASNFVNKIVDASSSFYATPTGTDSTTAFYKGGKISSANPHRFIFDVSTTQTYGTTSLIAIASPTSGMPATLKAYGSLHSDNVNGVTLIRPVIDMYYHNGTDWDLFQINTTNIPSLKTLSIQVLAYIL